jgi:hypothetical protein
MELSDLLRHIATVFEQLGVPYLITGSTATIAYGDPRFTNDIDVVVDLPATKIDELLLSFPDTEFYVSRSAVEAAVARRHQFNILHPTSGLKVDVIIASDSEFDRERLRRARQMPLLPQRTVAVASPEDVILKKMEYFREGESEKHLRDIAGMLRVQGDRIDRQYIEDWARRLNLTDVWQYALSQLPSES